ncbi:MAG: class A beta-lactamase-related serine hydrolase [Negativicutes bacterium]|nr:class A beta-lactamase-related serine hydrolase [Negativicutes bacterium]
MFSRKMFMSLMLLFLLMNLLPAYAGATSIDIDIRGFDGTVGVFAKNLKTGKTVAYNQDVVFPTASTSKLVVALAAYKYLYPNLTMDARNSYDEVIERMIEFSDNDAFYYLLSEIDDQPFDLLSGVIADFGLPKTKIHNSEAFKEYQYSSVTTPFEMASIFLRIFDGDYLCALKSQTLTDELANTIFNDEIPRYLSSRVMHKVGQLDDILCDVGIVDDGKDKILISIYTETDKGEEYASDFIAAISQKLYAELK